MKSQNNVVFSLLIGLVVILFAISNAHAVLVYTGTLASPDQSGVTSGDDGWGPHEDGFSVIWTIYENPDHTWHYKYDFYKGNGEPLEKLTSHFIISLSDNIQESDLFNFSSDIEDPPTFGTFGPSKSNPGFPTGETISGIKFDMTNEQDTVEFDSTRMPMWGDFYAKDGKSGGLWNYAYNTDLGIAVVNLQDYENPALDEHGNFLHKILVPDTIITVPEPATICILALGAILLRKRKTLR